MKQPMAILRFIRDAHASWGAAFPVRAMIERADGHAMSEADQNKALALLGGDAQPAKRTAPRKVYSKVQGTQTA